MEDFETTVKVLVVGSAGVGKSALVRRFARGTFDETHKATIGVDFAEKRIDVNYEEVIMNLWDTAPVFNNLTQKYYSGASVAVICFSTVDRKSFEDVESWYEKLRQECGAKVLTVLVQNKTDLMAEAQISSDEVEGLARKLSLRLYRACCKDDANVSEMFTFLAERYIATGGGGEAVSTIHQLNAMSPVKDSAPPPGPPRSPDTGPGAAAAAASPAPTEPVVQETGVDPDHADELAKSAEAEAAGAAEAAKQEKKSKFSKDRKKKKCAIM